ncbi:MAG: hypothetical protein K8S99_08310 [Planctomycetes bacterium]|nr:hypothetical protein [Planctomycetota bacterium]
MTRNAALKPAALLLAVLMLAGAGCQKNKTKAEKEDVHDPTIRLLSARLAAATDHGARIEVLVELENPNRVALPLIESQYTLTVGGSPSLHGEDCPNRTLPAGGKQIVMIPVAVPAAVAAGAAYSVEGSVSYEPPGEMRRLFTESKIPLPSVGFSGSGNLQ